MDVKELSKKTKKELEKEKDSVIFSLKQENVLLKQRIAQLETSMQKQSTITPEELICIEQIAIVKSKSSNRELSLDEVKRLDILIKNLRLIQDQSTEAIDHKDYRNVKEVDLVAIARRSEEDDQ